MAQPAVYKIPLSIPPFWQKATPEPPMEWPKWTVMMEMAVLAKDGKEVRTLLRARPRIKEPTEPIYELEVNNETEIEKRKRDLQNKEKKVRERGPLCNNFN